MRRSPFDLQFASSHLLPLLFIYLGLAHYVACAYWGVVLYRLPPNVADGSTGWQSAVPLDAPGSEYDFSEWLPSETLLRSGELWKWYFRASYFSISTLTGLGKDLLPLDDVATLFTILVFVVGVLSSRTSPHRS